MEINIASTDATNIIEGKHPIPFCVMDNVMPADLFEGMAGKLPNMDDPEWFHYSNPLEEKYALNNESKFPVELRAFIEVLRSEAIQRFIPKVLNLVEPEVVPDPRLLGAGVHRIPRGGKLDLHLDHNRNSELPNLERKVNLIYWFHPRWEDDWGGELEIWDSEDGKPTECAVKIRPNPNRLAMFKASDYSFHGHPAPLNCPDGIFWTSLALYYFSDNLEDKEVRHKVKFVATPGGPDSSEIQMLRDQRADPKTSAAIWNMKGK